MEPSAERKFTDLPQWLRSDRPDQCIFCRGIGEHAETCALADTDRPDFTNTDLLDRAMAYGDVHWLEKVRAFCDELGMNGDEIDRSIECQRLRRTAHAAMKGELAARMTLSPAPTAEELSMGSFMEGIEPQVRGAARVMRRKGYATSFLGFSSLDAQSAELASPDLLDLTPDETAAIEDAGIRLSEGRNGFSFRIIRADLEEIKKTWDEVAELLPDLGHAAPDAHHPAAVRFREKHGKRTG